MHWGHTPGLLPSVGGMQGSRTLTRLLGWVFLAGFTCFYKRRTGCKTDGCAVCYKPTRFRLLCASPVEYFRPGLELLNRDNVGLVLLLQPLVPEGLGQVSVAPLCVANTHVLYNPRRGDVKLAQMAILLAEVDKVARLSDGSHCPVVLCGDLNSVPNSPLYNFVRDGELQYHGMPAWKVRWERPLWGGLGGGSGCRRAGLLLWQGPQGHLCCLTPAFSCPVDSSGTHAWMLGARECLWYTGILSVFIINLCLVYEYISKCIDVHKYISIRIQALLHDS